MVQPNQYYNLQSAEPDSPLGYLLQCLLESRLRLGLQSDASREEAINIYLGHLLVEVMTPTYQARALRYVGSRGSDIFEMVEELSEPREKFMVYRTNADHRLLATSVFRPPADADDATSPAQGHQDEGRTYYHFAAEYNRQCYRKTTSLTDILETLSEAFEKYERILTHMRHAYLDLWQTVPQEQFEERMQQVVGEQSPSAREVLVNAFLEAYRAWRLRGAPAERERVNVLAQRLSALDPEFRFDQFTLQ